MNYQQPAAAKQKVRAFTWVILVINVLFLIWVIAGAASSSGDATNCGSLDQDTCNSAEDAGTAIGVFLIVMFWAAVDLILGIVWLVTRRREPAIVYVQQSPGYAPGFQAAVPVGGWYQAPTDPPGILRWWDGRAWTDQTHRPG